MRSARGNTVKYEELRRLRSEAYRVLDSQIAPFWCGMQDNDNGGFYGDMDMELELHREADKGCILQSRILWFFSELASLTGKAAYIKAADHAFRFLTEHCIDRRYGGVFWSVTYDGNPADTTKHTYAQAFAVYALSSYYALTGSEPALDTALKLFRLIETKCRDSSGYLESFDRCWSPSENDKLSENNVIAQRTMNTLLHVFEAYANLYRCHPNRDIADAMSEILRIFENNIYSHDKQRLEVFFDSSYHSLVDLQSYGHDIETSWLLDEGCSLLEGSELADRIYSIDTALAESVYDRAFSDSSLLNECENGINDTDRIWWVQSEAIVGFVNQWQKTKESRYLRAADEIFRYIQLHIADSREGSEWLWGVHADGSPMDGHGIVNEWKCPYHSGRMCLELIRRSGI